MNKIVRFWSEHFPDRVYEINFEKFRQSLSKIGFVSNFTWNNFIELNSLFCTVFEKYYEIIFGGNQVHISKLLTSNPRSAWVLINWFIFSSITSKHELPTPYTTKDERIFAHPAVVRETFHGQIIQMAKAAT